MATKECTVYIVDVGQSVGKRRHGRDITDLDWSLQYIWDKLATVISTGRKTLFTGVLGLRTDGTQHDGPQEEAYDNISVFKSPSQLLMPDVRKLTEQFKPSNTDHADAVSAIILAIGIINDHCKQLKYEKKIILSTNGTCSVETDQLHDIAQKLNDDEIELCVVGVDFDDPEYGIKEEDKDEAKQRNEATLAQLVELCEGTIGTLKQATDEIKTPRLHIPNSVASFKGKLTLGDSEIYETAMEIDVERYPKVMPKSANSVKRVVVKPEDSTDAVSPISASPNGPQQKSDENSLVQTARSYHIKDEAAPGGKREITRDGLSKGYEYGREVVHMDPADEEANRMETVAGMAIIGFVQCSKIAHYLDMSRSFVTVAQKQNDLAAMALSSLIHTLYELSSCAIARLVLKDAKAPVIIALVPSIEKDFECLIDVEVPFAEDFRQHKFPPLDRVPTLSGKVITEHRNLPSRELKDAMGAYVDSMDLTRADKDDDGNPSEYLKFEDSFAPKPNGINQAVRHRAIHPDGSLPPPNDVLTRYAQPPDDLMKRAHEHLERLQKEADVKKVPPKSLSRREFKSKKNQDAPRSGLDVSALLNDRSSKNQYRISSDNAIPEFKQTVGPSGAEDIEVCKDAVKQLGVIMEDWTTQSMGESNYGRVIEGLKVMRENCIDLEEPGEFNEFLRELKKKIFEEKLGGDRRELWWQIRMERIELIKKDESEYVDVDAAHARQFLIPDRTRA